MFYGFFYFSITLLQVFPLTSGAMSEKQVTHLRNQIQLDRLILAPSHLKSQGHLTLKSQTFQVVLKESSLQNTLWLYLVLWKLQVHSVRTVIRARDFSLWFSPQLTNCFLNLLLFKIMTDPILGNAKNSEELPNDIQTCASFAFKRKPLYFSCLKLANLVWHYCFLPQECFCCSLIIQITEVVLCSKIFPTRQSTEYSSECNEACVYKGNYSSSVCQLPCKSQRGTL